MNKDEKILKQFTSKEYEHGWSVDLEVDQAPNGLNEDIIKLISKKKNEPSWLLKWRLDCLLYTSPSPRDVEESRMPSSA